MRLKVLHIGKTNSKEIEVLCKDFHNRTGRFMKCDIDYIPKVKGSISDPFEIKSKEGAALLKQVNRNDFLLILDEAGKHMDSRSFATWLSQHYVNDSRSLVFVIGGAYGFSDEVYQRADFKLSLSSFTFNHELALLVLLEQVYRACTIISGHPYHND